ncbi:MAG: DapH/DapD/GlmU-related protein [Candidatus Hodarchaeota archaeon]
MEYSDEDIPTQLKKLVEMYPLLKKLKFYNPYFFDKTSGGKNKEIQEYIEKTQENLIKELYQNAKKSAAGEGKRKIRPATEDELDHYNKMTTDNLKKMEIDNHLNILSTGLPEFKALHFKHIGGKIGKKVMITYGNIIDPYFPEKISIGDNSILGMGACIFAHEFIDGKLYVGDVNLGRDCLLAFGTVILPGVTIGNNSVVEPGILTSDVDQKTMTGGLMGNKRVKYEERKKKEPSLKRKTEDKPYTLHDWHKMMGNPIKFGLTNLFMAWAKSPNISNTFRKQLLRLAGIKIGKNVTIESDVHFDSFWPERITIEDGAVIKKHSAILTHEGLIDRVRAGDVKIGKNVTVESGSGILPGTEIDENVTIFPYSFITCNIPANTRVSREKTEKKD